MSTALDSVITPTFDRHLDEGWRRTALVDEVHDALATHPRRLTPRWLYDDRGQRAVRPDHPTARVLPDRGRAIDPGRARRHDHRALGRQLRRRARLRDERQDAHVARCVRSGRSARPLRAARRERTDVARRSGRVGRAISRSPRPRCGRRLPRAPRRRAGLRNAPAHVPRLDHRQLLSRRAAAISGLGGQLDAGGWRAAARRRHRQAGRSADGGLQRRRRRDRRLHRESAPCAQSRARRCDFDPDGFEYVGLWDPKHTRVDLRLRSLREQQVRLPEADVELAFAEDEELRVEISTKFSVPQITGELEAVGLGVQEVWTDDEGDVALILATA